MRMHYTTPIGVGDVAGHSFCGINPTAMSFELLRSWMQVQISFTNKRNH